jgi:hypothetical protein
MALQQYPEGKECLFDNNVYFTDIDYTENFRHDIETGAPIRGAKYLTMNSAGIAILKAQSTYLPWTPVVMTIHIS